MEQSAAACHIAWAGAAARSHALEVPAALAGCLGLSDGMLVSLQALPDVAFASSVSVEPANEDDWEQVELNADYMEEQILNQVQSSYWISPWHSDDQRINAACTIPRFCTRLCCRPAAENSR